MTIAVLILSLLAFALFALSTDDHHRRRLGRRPDAMLRRRLRVGAWLALAAAFPCAVASRGWVFGPVLWIAVVMLAAGVVFLAANLIPSPKEPAR